MQIDGDWSEGAVIGAGGPEELGFYAWLGGRRGKSLGEFAAGFVFGCGGSFGGGLFDVAAEDREVERGDEDCAEEAAEEPTDPVAHRAAPLLVPLVAMT